MPRYSFQISSHWEGYKGSLLALGIRCKRLMLSSQNAGLLDVSHLPGITQGSSFSKTTNKDHHWVALVSFIFTKRLRRFNPRCPTTPAGSGGSARPRTPSAAPS